MHYVCTVLLKYIYTYMYIAKYYRPFTSISKNFQEPLKFWQFNFLFSKLFSHFVSDDFIGIEKTKKLLVSNKITVRNSQKVLYVISLFHILYQFANILLNYLIKQSCVLSTRLLSNNFLQKFVWYHK